MTTETTNAVLLEIEEKNNKLHYTTSILSARTQAELELQEIEETIASVQALVPNCDKTDYTLAACSGVLCGLIDIFFVGIPKDSALGNITDKWFDKQECHIAKLLGGEEKDTSSAVNAIKFLENKFGVCYDQTGLSGASKEVFGLSPSNHHYKSLGHHPSIAGLIWSVLDQFNNTSHFVTDGQLIELVDAKEGFKLQGNNAIAKIWCGIVNWLGHLISDVCGSSNRKLRGMGIPSPFMSWINTVIAIKAKLNIPASEFDKNLNQLALDLFLKGFDFRFQTTQAIPVILNELLVRFMYSFRRLLKYYKETPADSRSFKQLWATCKPYNNVTLSRMLMVAHGTFCLMDIGEAAVQGFIKGGGQFNPVEFFLRVNIIGVGRFTLCLYSEAQREFRYHKAKKAAEFAERRKSIIKDYLEGLDILEQLYDDHEYLTFVDDLKHDEYIAGFSKTVQLAHLRKVPETKILQTKSDIDNYFNKR